MVSFDSEVVLEMHDPDDDIFIRTGHGGCGRHTYHIYDEQCTNTSDSMKQKDPATQYNDLALCSECRWRALGDVVALGDVAYLQRNCTFFRPDSDVARLVCEKCDWAIDSYDLPRCPFGMVVHPPQCPGCSAGGALRREHVVTADETTEGESAP